MKKLSLLLSFLYYCLMLTAQTVTNHPIDLVNSSVEANEFLILHTDGAGGSSPATKATIGKYDPAGGNLSQKIIESNSVTNLSTFNTRGNKFLNAIVLDYNGDSYDEAVFVVETSNGVKVLAYPGISKIDLSSNIGSGDKVNNLPTPASSGQEIVKMDKGDLNGDGKEELVLLTRTSSTSALRIQIRSFGPSPATNGSVREIEYGMQAFVPLTSNYEAFDIAVGDFDNDGKLDLAVVAFEQGGSSRQCYVQLFEVKLPDPPNFPTYQIIPKGKLVLTPTGGSNGWENVAITAYKKADGVDQIGVALAFTDPNDPNTINKRIYSVITDNVPGVYDLNNPVSLGSPYSSSDMGGIRPAISMASGDLNDLGNEETIVAWNGEIQMMEISATSINVTTTTSAGSVQEDFYKKVRGNNYVSIGDVDYDKNADVLVVTTDIDDNSGNPMHSLKVSIFASNQLTTQLSLKGQKKIQTEQHTGAASDYHYAALLGEFQGGRAMLKEPSKIVRKLFTPLIINNSPPHHFDIVNTVEADILEAYPNWPSTASTGTINSQYQAVTNTSRTLETELKSDWGVSSTLSAGFSKLGSGIKASVTGKYGEEFSQTQTNTNSVTISTLSTAYSDDQLYGVVQDYEVYEYPVDSSGYTIGYVLAMMRVGTPIIQWMDSKSSDAFSYVPIHEPGNIFSYPSSTNFNEYAGVRQLIREGASKNIGSGGSLEFTMAFSDFASSSASVTRSFGIEVNVEANASFKYFDVGLEVNGTYNRSEMTSHTSTAFSEISFTSDLSRALNPQFSDANYTVTPHVYWADNGALTLAYVVDPSIPAGGTNNFWTDYYGDKPDLTMILPWRLDEEKGFSLGSTPDKKRLSKSISLDKTSFVVGDIVNISAFIYNYSLVDYSGDVEFQFYAGNPDNGGKLLRDANGQSTLSISGGFPARERTRINFAWKVQAGIDRDPPIYVVIDPNNLISEIHEDNNTGFYPLGPGSVNAIEDKFAQLPVQAKLFPNPAIDKVELEMILPNRGELTVEILDLHGRLVKTAYQNDLHKGNFILPIDLSELQNGYYIVKIGLNNQQQLLKLVKSN